MVEDLEMVNDDGGLREKCDLAVSAEAELHFTSLGIKSDLGERCAPWVGKYTRVGAGRVKCCVIISLPARQWKVN